MNFLFFLFFLFSCLFPLLLTQVNAKKNEERIKSFGSSEEVERHVQNLNNRDTEEDKNGGDDRRLLEREEVNLRNEMYKIKELHGRASPEYVARLHGLGRNIYKQGRYDEVFDLAEEIVSIHEEMDGPEHINTAKALTNVGSTANKLGMRRTCETAMNRALFIFIKEFGEDAKEVRCFSEYLCSRFIFCVFCRYYCYAVK
jgi:hypothetical protein